jgi:predicted GIY-YIG superfamily endonuclease
MTLKVMLNKIAAWNAYTLSTFWRARETARFIVASPIISPGVFRSTKAGAAASFTARYNVVHLVWFENYSEINAAIAREKQIKHWNRAWKLALIEAMNPSWRDLFDDLNK